MNLKNRLDKLEAQHTTELVPAIIFSFDGELDEHEAQRKHDAIVQGRIVKTINFVTV